MFKFFLISREKNVDFFRHYSILISEAKYKPKHGEGLKILSPRQMFRRLPIALAQVKAGNTFYYLKSENLGKSCIICIEKKKLLKKCTTI